MRARPVFNDQRVCRGLGKGSTFVRLAELEIDPAHLERFKVSAKKQIEAAVRMEPGVLALTQCP
jgi:hypothetical protein